MLRERYSVFRRGPWRYVVAIALTALAFGIRWALEPILEGRSPFVASVLGVALCAISVGAWPALLSMFIGLALSLLVFVERGYTIFPRSAEDVVQASLYLLSSLVIIAAAEVTERERARGRSARDRFRLLTEQAREYGVITTDPKGIIQSWSKGAEQLFGYREDEVRGLHIGIIFTEEDRRNDAPDDELRRAEEAGHRIGERWLARRDGSRFFGMSVLVPFRDDRGKIVEFAKILRDGTQLKRREEALAQRAERSESALVETTGHIDAFTYTVAHDLRAPLRALDGYAKALRDECAGELQADGREYVARILAAAHRMDELVSDLLEFWRLTRMREPRTTVDANAILDRVLASLSLDIEAAKARIEREVRLPMVHGHSECLYKALCHLVGNALKFAPPDKHPRVQIGCERRNGFVRVYVKDNGPGIAPEYHGRIFRVFERLREDKPGTGIGLSIVHKCAELMGGRAGVDSKPGDGSCFWLELKSAEPSSGH